MLDGIPMIKRVYDACIASKIPTYVLTDDMRIFNMFGPDKCWIEQEHVASYANGTERCAGAVAKWDELKQYDQFINVQGDMPDVTIEMIDKVKWHLQHYPITTVWTQMPEEKQNDPNTVKMIKAGDQCLWFGRGMTGYGDWHLGVYGYRRNALEFYSTLEVTQEENIERLEQLRWLKSGWQIGCLNVQYNGTEINTPEDVTEWHNKHSQ
jgi:3-deoxy-manno-octulosonate cytidylyltransferase (CMP-KDO synthetase)